MMPVRTVIRKRSHKAQEGPRLREAPSHLHHPCRLSQVSVEDFGLVEDLVDWDAHNSPRSPNLPRSSGGGTHQSTLVHHRSRKPQKPGPHRARSCSARSEVADLAARGAPGLGNPGGGEPDHEHGQREPGREDRRAGDLVERAVDGAGTDTTSQPRCGACAKVRSEPIAISR